MKVVRRPGHSKKQLFRTTVSAQIHFLGAVLMVIGALFLLPATERLPAEFRWANLSFVISGVIVFFGSFLFHFLTEGYQASSNLEILLEKIDHFGIYLFIAGTYTAFVVPVIDPPWKMILIYMIWTMAVVGIFYTWFQNQLPKILRSRFVYTLLFVLMGWTILIRTGEVYRKLGAVEMFLFFGGAISYTLGAVVFYRKKPNLFGGILGHHEIWHFMVIMGAAFHYFLIYSFCSPEVRQFFEISASKVAR